MVTPATSKTPTDSKPSQNIGRKSSPISPYIFSIYHTFAIKHFRCPRFGPRATLAVPVYLGTSGPPTLGGNRTNFCALVLRVITLAIIYRRGSRRRPRSEVIVRAPSALCPRCLSVRGTADGDGAEANFRLNSAVTIRGRNQLKAPVIEEKFCYYRTSPKNRLVLGAGAASSGGAPRNRHNHLPITPSISPHKRKRVYAGSGTVC